jgi:hypothetical protein
MDSNTAAPEFLSLEDRIAVYTPMTEASLDAAVEMIGNAVEFCRSNNIEGLLIDARGLHGFPHPTVVDRYWFVRRWAEIAGGKVVLSLIQRPEMMDPEQIGVTIANNAGLTANVFDNEPDARAWLFENI